MTHLLEAGPEPYTDLVGTSHGICKSGVSLTERTDDLLRDHFRRRWLIERSKAKPLIAVTWAIVVLLSSYGVYSIWHDVATNIAGPAGAPAWLGSAAYMLLAKWSFVVGSAAYFWPYFVCVVVAGQFSFDPSLRVTSDDETTVRASWREWRRVASEILVIPKLALLLILLSRIPLSAAVFAILARIGEFNLTPVHYQGWGDFLAFQCAAGGFEMLIILLLVCACFRFGQSWIRYIAGAGAAGLSYFGQGVLVFLPFRRLSQWRDSTGRDGLEWLPLAITVLEALIWWGMAGLVLLRSEAWMEKRARQILDVQT